ncbi:MAG: N-acetylmuramoyl-L-alanine amidase, partial [Candidatus Omnitrophica bacterium]|nr:N-acetylmuramoyl-L-alanine amidase [Candidatus Omnitrophota bacterium]
LVVVVGLLCILSSCVSTRVPPSLVGGNVGGNSPEYVMRQGLYHSVAPGETLWRISKMYDVDIAVIREINEISDVKDLDIGRQLYIPSAAKRKNVITLYPNRKWKYIVIHHSATDKGSSSRFNNAHLRRGWNGVGYHFIIDNGTCGKDDGQIETSPRWIKQIDGAHCKAGSMNIKAIGICLVGNFSEDTVSVQQMSSLVYLTNQLRNYYNIPESHIVGHGQVSGAKTECPGTRFPWKDFWTRIRKKEK